MFCCVHDFFELGESFRLGTVVSVPNFVTVVVYNHKRVLNHVVSLLFRSHLTDDVASPPIVYLRDGSLSYGRFRGAFESG